ncbi:MAG: UDP-N-acetylmuramate dehydrogenase [Planctomycetota bacterium]
MIERRSRVLEAACWSGAERDRPLDKKTSFRIGGPAALFIEPAGLGELRQRIEDAHRVGLPVKILGGGTNLLVADEGVEALVVSMRGLRGVDWRGRGVLTVAAGESLPALVRACARRGWAGFECLGGIPGTVGGAVAMRSGGSKGDCWEHLVSVMTLDARGDVHIDGSGSLLERLDQGQVIVSATFELVPGEPESVRLSLEELIAYRDATQPLSLPSAGCMFRNPVPECAGRLIDRSGLKGSRSGAAIVSTQHANFIINSGAASARDVIALAEHVQRTVREQTGVVLEREVTFWA